MIDSLTSYAPMKTPLTKTRGFRIAVVIVVILMALAICLSEVAPLALGGRAATPSFYSTPTLLPGT